MSLVYSYMRFSDPRQATGNSSERQGAYAARWAQEHGLRLDETLTMRDEGLSAYHQRHVKSGALGVFLVAVEEGRVPAGSVLIVEGLDRLSRAEPMVAQGQLASIVNAGITVVTASDGHEYSRETLRRDPMKLIYSLLVMIRAHEESDTKSRRVTASIVKLCRGWQAGTYRGKIRNGKDPQWTRETEDGWELIPERVDALRQAIDLYKGGHSGQSISRRLAAVGMSPLNASLGATHFYKLVKNPALVGIKRISAGGEDFELQGYYPAALTVDEWDEVQAIGGDRGRRAPVSSDIPHVLTGLGITYCGYCGRAMSGQHLYGKIKHRGDKLKDGYRRLLCAGKQYGDRPCPHPASRSVAPVERALMNYCSDIMNLKSLYGGDRAAPLRTQLTTYRKQLADITDQSERLMKVMLSTGANETPAMFTKKARELETERANIQRAIVHCEAQISALARHDPSGVNKKWRALAKGVQELDADSRLQARQLVADTFERIVVYATGVRPNREDRYTDVVLLAKGGVEKLLHIDSTTGEWSVIETLDEREAAQQQPLKQKKATPKRGAVSA